MILDFDLNLKCNPDYLKFLGDESKIGKKTEPRQDASKVKEKMTSFAFLASWRE